MSFKADFKREMRNVVKDVEKEINKTWKIDYKRHSIEIRNQIKEEQLIIDGMTVDKKQRKSVLSHNNSIFKIVRDIGTSRWYATQGVR
ncbi:hypothetical protein [Bacillus pumilus]|uniref:hypothetical protein n=1 Tax=Bacillus pumilus TaxID=1408 RepID=UPI001FB53364|nr:hypothetical protein [Bacillus pumilus]